MIDHYMATLRSMVSLLIEKGHAHAGQYPLNRVFAECLIVNRRIASEIRLDTMLTQLAFASTQSKEAAKVLNEALTEIGSL